MEHFAGLDVSVEGNEHLHCGITGQDCSRSQGRERTRRTPANAEDQCLPLQADWTGSRATVGTASDSAFAEANLPVICVETRHMRAVLKAQINKTDRNDARGIAQMMRAGLYRPVHVKTLRSQKLRTLLTHRKLLQSKAIAEPLRTTCVRPCVTSVSRWAWSGRLSSRHASGSWSIHLRGPHRREGSSRHGRRCQRRSRRGRKRLSAPSNPKSQNSFDGKQNQYKIFVLNGLRNTI